MRVNFTAISLNNQFWNLINLITKINHNNNICTDLLIYYAITPRLLLKIKQVSFPDKSNLEQ